MAYGCNQALDCTGDANGARSDIDQPVAVAGSTVGATLGPLAIDNASAQSGSSIQVPANTTTPFSITINCASALTANYVPAEERLTRADQTAWIHFAINNPAGASYSISTPGPSGTITDGGQVGGGGAPLRDTTHGISVFVVASDPGANAIPPAGQPFGNTFDIFSATPPQAAYALKHGAPTPTYRGGSNAFPAGELGSATGVLPQGEYTIGLLCMAESESKEVGAYTYGGSISYQSGVTVTIDAVP